MSGALGHRLLYVAQMPFTLYITDALHTAIPCASIDTGGGGYYLSGQLAAASQPPCRGLRGGRAYLPHQRPEPVPGVLVPDQLRRAGKLKIIRYIGDLGCGGGLYPPSYRSQYIPYGCATMAALQAAQLMIANATAVSVTCGAIAWSAALTRITTWDLQDPLSDSVTLSQ